MQVDHDYYLTQQKKAYLQLAHFNRLLELHARLNFSLAHLNLYLAR
jgi:hypothetical protein